MLWGALWGLLTIMLGATGWWLKDLSARVDTVTFIQSNRGERIAALEEQNKTILAVTRDTNETTQRLEDRMTYIQTQLSRIETDLKDLKKP